MSKLFGTDGIRGVANSYPMTPEMALQVGRAVACIFRTGTKRPRVLIGQDTRVSGDMIAHALASGICSAGADAELAGVLPTPGIAFAARVSKASAGIVVSASHNPYQDNGIKIFGSDGFKLPDEKEAEIEKLVLSGRAAEPGSANPDTGRVRSHPEAPRVYAGFLRQCAPARSSRMNDFKVVLDCAHGATYQIAPRVFSDLGFSVEALNVEPDGTNINHHCGSQHPEGLAQRVVAAKADIGLAFDGDGDRLIAVDDRGEVITGDRVLAVCAQHLQLEGRLKNSIVVSTVMSNVGLSRTLKGFGIRHLTTQVGDRYVVEAMRAAGAVLGGEDSGHMIFAEHHTTGDGILSALMLVQAIQAQQKPLSVLKEVMTPFPQVLINVPVKSKPPIESVARIQKTIRDVEADLGDSGRVLVRYSGTESLCRVMVEGPTEDKTRAHCNVIADAVKEAIG